MIDNCEQMIKTFEAHPEKKPSLAVDLIPLIEHINTQRNLDLSSAILKLLSRVIDEKLIQEGLCLLGGLPLLFSFASFGFSDEIRLYVSIISKALCCNPTHATIFVSAKGIPIITQLLEGDYARYPEMIDNALHSLISVLQLHVIFQTSELTKHNRYSNLTRAHQTYF